MSLAIAHSRKTSMVCSRLRRAWCAYLYLDWISDLYENTPEDDIPLPPQNPYYDIQEKSIATSDDDALRKPRATIVMSKKAGGSEEVLQRHFSYQLSVTWVECDCCGSSCECAALLGVASSAPRRRRYHHQGWNNLQEKQNGYSSGRGSWSVMCVGFRNWKKRWLVLTATQLWYVSF